MAIEPVDIANMALAVLDEAPIDSLDQDSKAARLLNLHYDLTREAELAKHPWVFAILSASVEGNDTGTGDGTLKYVYDVPPDALRVLPLTYDGEPTGIPISWRQEAGLIYTDQESPRIIRYIANLTDPNDWSPLFTEVLVAALAVKIAHALTHKAGMIDVARAAYERAMAEARRANAFEISGKLYRQSWAAARGDNRYGRA